MIGDGGRVVKEIEGKPGDSGFSTSNKRRYIKKEDLLYSTENCTQYLVITFKFIFPFLPLIPMKSPKQMDSAFRKHTSTSLITGIPCWLVMLILDLRSPCLEFSQKRKKKIFFLL